MFTPNNSAKFAKEYDAASKRSNFWNIVIMLIFCYMGYKACLFLIIALDLLPTIQNVMISYGG